MALRTERGDVRDVLSSGKTFLTFPGVETYMLFEQQFPLRDFCAFEVFEDDEAWADLSRAVLVPTVRAAAAGGHGLITDALVWRASPDYVSNLGYTAADVERINRAAVARVDEAVTAAVLGTDTPIILPAISGLVATDTPSIRVKRRMPPRPASTTCRSSRRWRVRISRYSARGR